MSIGNFCVRCAIIVSWGVIALPSDLPRLTVRLDPEIHYKLRYIADDCFRPINSELTMLILKRIADYEREHGEIKIPEE